MRPIAPRKLPPQAEEQRDRMKAKLQEVKGELRRRMRQPIPEQGGDCGRSSPLLCLSVVPTNSRALGAFQLPTARLWRRVLRRRSQKDGFTWKRIGKLAADFLPNPRILHPWPSERLLSTPEVGAVCGKPARTDLGGGRPVMDDPIAIQNVSRPVRKCLPVVAVASGP